MYILTEISEFPTDDMEMTQILIITNLERSKKFYIDILGATMYREYGGTSCVINFQGTWLLLVTGGGPTPDKPDITFEAPTNPTRVSHSFTIRVKDCIQSYEILRSRGATFLTPPYDWGAEIRAFFKDPDGHLFEISEYRSK